MRFTRLLLVTSLVTALGTAVLPAQAAQPIVGAPHASTHIIPPQPVGPVHPGPPPRTVKAILYDQYNNAGGVGTSSDDFQPNRDWDQFDDLLADDFVVPLGKQWRIQQVKVSGTYDKQGQARWVNVHFYTDNGGLPGSSVYGARMITPSCGLSSGSFCIDLPTPALLSPGTYWLSVQAAMNYPRDGTWRWVDRKVQSNSGAAWENPGGGFGINACKTWGTRHTTCNLDPPNPDQVFQILGRESKLPPSIDGLSPNSGPVGTPVTITGSGFTGATAVKFNGTAAVFTVDSDAKISTAVPAHATTGYVKVTAPGGTATSPRQFKVTPAITGFDPPSGPVGTVVTITGTTFTGATDVTFHGKSATFTVDSYTQITATVPPGATTGPIKVTTPSGTATSATDFVVVPLVITGVTPGKGPVGTPVTITGSGFTGATAVRFHGTSAAFTVDSDAQISTTVPAGATTGYIKVTTPAGTATSPRQFRVTPAITGFDPPSGPVGTVVTITGTTFTGATDVTFHKKVSADFTVDSDTQITATVPPGATTGPIKVVTPSGTAVSATDFIVMIRPGGLQRV